MAKQTALGNPSHTARLSYYDHDMSMIRKFSSSVGQLLPVYYDMLYPGDKVDFSTEMFSRFDVMSTPAMVQVTQHVDWFFVPLTQLYQFFGDWIFGIQDFKTDFIQPSGSTSPVVQSVLPSVQLNRLHQHYKAATVKYSALTDVEKDLFGVPKFFNDIRLLELLGYSSHATDYDNANVSVNPFMLAAYQKIFYDVYRISDRQANDPQAYNFDSIRSSTAITNARAAKLMELHYRPWKSDFFTSVKVSPIVSNQDIGMMSTENLTAVNNWLNSVGLADGDITFTASTLDTMKNGSNNGLQQMLTQTADGDSKTRLTTSDLRSLFAVEKLAEITRRAAKHYDAQVLAHFGFDVPTGIAGEVYRLGSDIAQIQIDTIEGTATTGVGDNTSRLGELAGKGTSYGNNKTKHFTAPCHGILMAIYSAVPESDYSSDGFDRLNSYLFREDYYQPELENIGMQPLFGYQSYFEGNVAENGSILGWQWRYFESKVKHNVINGSFNYTDKNWTTSKSFTDGRFENKLSDFLISPNYMDSVLDFSFQNAADDPMTKEVCFGRDPLKHMFQFHVHKKNHMSPFSLPSL